MKTIKYNNKTIKLPFAGADYSDEPLTMEKVTNPFSGQSIELPIKVVKEKYDSQRYRYTDNGYQPQTYQATRTTISRVDNDNG